MESKLLALQIKPIIAQFQRDISKVEEKKRIASEKEANLQLQIIQFRKELRETQKKVETFSTKLKDTQKELKHLLVERTETSEEFEKLLVEFCHSSESARLQLEKGFKEWTPKDACAWVQLIEDGRFQSKREFLEDIRKREMKGLNIGEFNETAWALFEGLNEEDVRRFIIKERQKIK